MYSTEPRVRLEAGFTDNANISVATVEEYQRQAFAIINGVVSKRYNLSSMLSDAGFPGSDAQKMLARCEELLGAGHLLNKDYDIQDQEGNSNGTKKIKEAYDILDKILTGVIILTDATYDIGGNIIPGTGNEYPTVSSSSAGRPISYPFTGEGRIFTLTDQY